MTTNLGSLLKRTAEAIEQEADLSHITSGEAFEKFVFDKMIEVASRDASLPQDIIPTGKLAFPDIVVDGTWGVEVKFSNSGKWDSLGNSIFEGTSIAGLQEIFVLFGKKNEKNGNRIEVKFDLYENCVTDVKVTHSPRFIISMDEDKSSLFNELEIKYNDFKVLDKSQKGKQIKDYFKKYLKPGDDVWWIDQEESVSLPQIRTFNNLSKEEQDQLMVESFILFPEVLSNSSHTKYNRVAPYWLTRYQVYNPSLRDKFSASGRVDIKISPSEDPITVSKIYGVLFNLSPKIKDIIDNPTDEFFEIIKEKWEEIGVRSASLTRNSLKDFWKHLIDYHGIPPYPNGLPRNIFNYGIYFRT